MKRISGYHPNPYAAISPALGQGYEDFLARWPFEWFGTFTFANDVRPVTANRIFRGAIAMIETTLGQDIFFAKTQAPQHLRRVLHIHALMGGAAGFQPMPFMKFWERRYGWARIAQIYDLAGAVRYFVGHILRDNADIDFSENAKRYQTLRISG